MRHADNAPDPHSPSSRHTPCAPDTPVGTDWTPSEALLHRWLVEFNPLYLLSAMSVLSGIWILAREAAASATLLGALGVWGLGELYALALIGGAAFLVRIQQGRSAVMLSLLAAVFQGDPTMHLETCSYLGAVGVVAAAAWVALFAFKLQALAWALRLRLSVSALATLMLGASGLALMPHLLRLAGPSMRAVLVCGWLFALFASALWTRREVVAQASWDSRARRAVSATWGLWGALALAHAAYWVVDYRVNVLPLVPALVLLGLPLMRRERQVWLGAAVATALGYVLVPALFGFVLAMVTVSLLVAALREFLVAATTRPARGFEHPYRHAPSELVMEPPLVADPTARARLVLGALLWGYAALYMPDARSAAHTVHQLALLLPFCAVLTVGARLVRRPWFALPVLPLALHSLAQRGVVRLPESTLEWGVTSTTAGFAVLALALYGSWRMGARKQAFIGSAAQGAK